MKYITLFIVGILTTSIHSFAMEPSVEIWQKIKTLEYDTPSSSLLKDLEKADMEAEYTAYVQELHDYGVTLQYGIERYIQEEYEKVQQAFRKEWNVSDKAWENMGVLMEQVKKGDKKNESKETEIESSKGISTKVIECIIRKYQASKIALNLSIAVKNDDIKLKVHRDVDCEVQYEDQRIIPMVLYAGRPEFYIGKQHIWPEELPGIINHEIERIKMYHHAQLAFLELIATIQHQDILKEEGRKRFMQSKSVQNFVRMQEREADLMAASGSIYAAEEMCEYLDTRITPQSHNPLIDAQKFEHNESHFSQFNRFMWVKKILNLKKAENRLMSPDSRRKAIIELRKKADIL